MAIDPSTFWASDLDHNSPMSAESLKEAERLLNVKFPEELVALWRVQTGGSPQGLVFPTGQKTTWAEDHVPLPELFGIGSTQSPSGSHNIFNSQYMAHEWDLPPKQILLAGEGDWWITLDYRKSETPCVRWLDVDSGEDIELAPSFNQFLAGLLPASAVDEQTCRLAP